MLPADKSKRDFGNVVIKAHSIAANDQDIKIAAAGRGWLAVDKPQGLSLHNDPGSDLCSQVVRFFNENSMYTEELGFDKGFGVSPVHRIDRDTSGVVLLGLQKEITAFFSRQFQDRSVEKRYVAVVHGLPESEGGESEWTTSLSPKAGGRKNPAGAGKKVPCVTRYRILEKSPHYSLIECELVTGRKHQIRRHAKLNKTPVAGDKRYGSPRSIRYLEENCSFSRLALHSLSLVITTPDGERLAVVSQTPQDFFNLMQSDR